MSKTLLFALAMAVAGAAVAQNAPRPDPKDPSAAVPAFTYRSAFEGYRPFVDQEVRDWRKANEEIGASGPGTRQNAPAQPPTAPSSKAAPPQGHGGHK